jgi:hypothetical protein
MKPKSKLETKLSELQQAELAEWLLTGMPYHRAQERVAKDFGLSVSVSAFTPFWERVCVPQLICRRSQQRVAAEVRAGEAEKNPAKFAEATLDALQERAMQLANSPQSDPKEVKAIYALILKARDQELTTQQMQLDREKFEFDAAEACLKKLPELKSIASNPKLDQQSKIQAIRQKLFGVLPVETQGT